MYQIFLLIIVFVLSFVYLRGRYNENYWKKRGVAFYERNKLLGIVWDFLTSDKAMFEVISDVCKMYENEPAVGVGGLMTPTLVLIDPQNIQHALQTDFQSFSHRGVEISEGDLLADNVLFMNGPRWKLMRQKMTPLFTAAKLRNMFYIIDRSALDFMKHLKENPHKLKANGYDTVNEFCSAAIAGAVFGIGTESTFKSPFLQMARDAVKVTCGVRQVAIEYSNASVRKTNLRFAVINASSRFSRALGLKIFKKQEKFFISAVKQVLRAREKESTKKHDFSDICLALQKAGTMRDPDTGFEMEPTDELLAAQGFFFFIAGVEPTASAMFGALTELGKRPDIQKKLQQEIDETMERNNGVITYEVISEMKYMDQVLSEALRMHSAVGFLGRQCVSDTVLPVGNIRVSEGTRIFVPVFNLHYNPKYFPDPEVFDPERFSPENKAQSDIAYMPFGRGGRICIGVRYARLQIMSGLLHLLRNYDVVSHVDKKSRKYAKGQFQLRQIDTDIELIPRKLV